MSEEINKNYYAQHKKVQAPVKINYHNLIFGKSEKFEDLGTEPAYRCLIGQSIQAWHCLLGN